MSDALSNIIIGASLALLPQCPVFTEFLPDPALVPDNEGEYIKLAWESQLIPWDSITLKMDDNKAFSIPVPQDSGFTSLLLHRSAPGACTAESGLLCLPLTCSALPNTRAVQWTLMAGDCRDTVYLPNPKSGMIFVRANQSGTEWESRKEGTVLKEEPDSLFFDLNDPQIYISEVAPCPENPSPEWFEITNRSGEKFPLNGISDCRTNSLLNTKDSLNVGASILITRDSSMLRSVLGVDEIPIAQIPIAALKNTADTLRLCYNGIQIDSVSWGAQVDFRLKCPQNFSRMFNRPSKADGFSPAFVAKEHKALKTIEIAERILTRSKKSSMLRIRISAEVTLELRLVDRNGMGIIRKNLQSKDHNSNWIEIPEWRRCQNGPCFIFLRGDGINESIPFVVRP